MESGGTQCPNCRGWVQEGANSCSICLLDLSAEEIPRLTEISNDLDRLTAERNTLLWQIHNRQMQQPLQPQAPPIFTTTAAANPSDVVIHHAMHGELRHQERVERAEWNMPSIQKILLGVGAVLCAMAALLFIAVNWGRFSVGAKATLMVTLTAFVGASSRYLLTRRLTSTAEALSFVACSLLLIDFGAAYALDFLDLKTLDAWQYWAFALAMFTVISVLFSARTPLVIPKAFALMLGQFPLLLVVGGAEVANLSIWVALFGAQSLLLLFISQTAKARLFKAISLVSCGATLGLVFLVSLGFTLFDKAFYQTVLPLLIVSLVVGSAPFVFNKRQPYSDFFWLGAILCVALDGIGTAARAFEGNRIELAITAISLLVVLLAFVFKTKSNVIKNGLVISACALAGIIALSFLDQIAQTFAVAYSWMNNVWTLASDDIYARIAPSELALWTGDGVSILTLTGIAFVAFSAKPLVPKEKWLGGVFLVAIVTALCFVPLVVTAPYLSTVTYLLLLATLLVLAPLITKKSQLTLEFLGIVVVTQALAWALAIEQVTIAALIWALIVALALAKTSPRREHLAMPTASVLLTLLAISIAYSFDASDDLVSLISVGINAVVATGAYCLMKHKSRWTSTVGIAGLVLLLSLFTLTDDAEMFSLAVFMVAAALVIGAVVNRESSLGWAAAATFVLFVWIRLAIADVALIEAYSLPLAALALSFGFVGERKGAFTSSWASYGWGLVIAALPSLVALNSDDGLIRPIAVGAIALTVIWWGASARLQAPITVGCITLLIDAVVQFGPYVHLIPRWLGVGVAGVALLVLGATWERRYRDLKATADAYTQLK